MEQLEFRVFGRSPELILKEEKRRVLVSPDDSLMGETISPKNTIQDYLISDYSAYPKTNKNVANDRSTDDILKELYKVIYLERIFRFGCSPAVADKLVIKRRALKDELKMRSSEVIPITGHSLPFLGICRRCKKGHVHLITFSDQAVQNHYETTFKLTGVGKIIKSEPRCDYCY